MHGFSSHRRRRRHGCSQCPHPYQVLSWVLSLCTVGSFYALVLPVLDPLPALLSCILYSLLCLLSLASGLTAMLTDPTDPSTSHPSPLPLHQYCSICKSRVQDYSKHCGQCNRCVNGFDHHCKWLNNCIGARNYRYFAVLIGSVSLLLVVEIVFGVVALQGVRTEDGRERLGNRYGVEGKWVVGVMVGLGVDLVGLIGCFVPLFRLVLLQLYLRKRGLTTYEYHMITRQRK